MHISAVAVVSKIWQTSPVLKCTIILLGSWKKFQLPNLFKLLRTTAYKFYFLSLI